MCSTNAAEDLAEDEDDFDGDYTMMLNCNFQSTLNKCSQQLVDTKSFLVRGGGSPRPGGGLTDDYCNEKITMVLNC